MCNKSFPWESKLKIHISTVHEGNMPFACSECDYTCAEKYKLAEHVAMVHENKKPHICSICNTAFGLKQYLIQHMKIVHKVLNYSTD